jgi:dihydroorotate dehydrogenase
MRKHLAGEVTLIGCGGISNGDDAIEFAKAGADFVQLYTAFAYKGPAIHAEMKTDILKQLDGRKWSEVVGTEV